MRTATIIVMTMLASAPAAARDADSIVFGSQIDSLSDYADELGDAASGGEEEAEQNSSASASARARADAIAGRAATDVEPGPVASETEDDDGTFLNFTLRQGFDSNYDESTEPEGSSFTELAATGAWASEMGNDGAYLGVGATALRLHALDWKERGDGYVDAAVRRDLGNGVAMQAGFGFSVDGTSDPIDGAAKAIVGLEGQGDGVVWGLQANVSTERALHAREVDEEIPTRAYDFVRPEVEASLLFRPEAKVSPYVSASLSRSTFPVAVPTLFGEEDEDEDLVTPDRDATTLAIHGGLRLRPVDALSVRAGVRGNVRRFDDGTLANLATLGPEVSGTWTISDGTTLEISASRGIGEPEEPGALAEDVTSFSATLEVNPVDALTLSATGSFDRTDVYGVASANDETSVDLSAVYKFNPKAAVEVKYFHYWYRDRVGEDDYERRRVSAGATLTF